jgi:hypothetical protein
MRRLILLGLTACTIAHAASIGSVVHAPIRAVRGLVHLKLWHAPFKPIELDIPTEAFLPQIPLGGITGAGAGGGSAPTLVQQMGSGANCNWASGTTYTCGSMTPANASNIIILSGGGGSTVTVSSIACNTNCGTWTINKQSNAIRNSYVACATLTGTGAFVATITLSGTPTSHTSVMMEWGNMNNGCTVDQTGTSGNGTSATFTAPSVTNTQAVDVNIANVYHGAQTLSTGPTNGYTELTANGDNTHLFPAYLITSSTGTYNTVWTVGSAVTYETNQVSYKQ